MGVGEEVDKAVDEAEELVVVVVVGSASGNRISPRLGNKALVVVVASWGMSMVVLMVVGRFPSVLVVPLSASPMPSRNCPCLFLLGAYRKTAAPDT